MIDLYNVYLNNFVNIVEMVLNTIAIFTVLKSVVIGLTKQLLNKGSAKHTICKGISNALNYNLATEVMKIVVVRDVKDLFIIAALLILKAMITALFMLEIKQDEMQEKHLEKYQVKKNNIIKKAKGK